jgi:Mrp family chromosome partitioning ATPase
VRRASQDLSSVGARVLGVALNNLNIRKDGYDYYRNYRQYVDYIDRDPKIRVGE